MELTPASVPLESSIAAAGTAAPVACPIRR
jgi:hypothetical protein